jgi:hypothetical protein
LSALLPFVAYFLGVSAITALVQALVREERPARIISEGLQFFLLVVGLIAGFSAFVYLLEWLFIRKP